jgi:hypothetical protein
MASYEQYIIEAAKKRGIDPSVALKVAMSEGGVEGHIQSRVEKNGHQEPSFGPFQLLKGGQNGFPMGMGNDFQTRTGLDPADPANTKATIDFALDQAKQVGWGPWYGAKAAGITGMEGIDGRGVTLNSAPSSIGPTNAAPALPEGVNVASHPVAGVAGDQPVMTQAPSGDQSLGDKLGAFLFGDKAADMKAAVSGGDKSNPVAAGLGAMTKAATRTAVPNDPIQSSLGASMGADAGRMQAAQAMMAQLLAKRKPPMSMSLPGRMV